MNDSECEEELKRMQCSKDSSSGILLYLALVFIYNFKQNRIAFLSANIDGAGEELSPLKRMKELLFKAQYNHCVTNRDIDNFSDDNGLLYDIFCERIGEEGFDFEETGEILWSNKESNYFEELILKLNNIEKKLLDVVQDNNKGLKYNSVKSEFEKIGLVIPQAFEKPVISGEDRRCWSFEGWKRKINSNYCVLRTNIIEMCSSILEQIKNNDEIILPYKRIVGFESKSPYEEECLISDIQNMLNNILECVPPVFWENSEKTLTQMYTRLLKEMVSLCEKIPWSEYKGDEIYYAKVSVLKMCRNWFSHQGIKGICDSDVALVFIIAMRTYFDIEKMGIEKKAYYLKCEQDILDIFINEEQVHNTSDIQEELLRLREKYEKKLVEVVKTFNNDPKISQSKKDNPKGFKCPTSKTSFYKIVSGIGHEYSCERNIVSMKDIKILFLESLYENGETKTDFNQEINKIYLKLIHLAYVGILSSK